MSLGIKQVSGCGNHLFSLLHTRENLISTIGLLPDYDRTSLIPSVFILDPHMSTAAGKQYCIFRHYKRITSPARYHGMSNHLRLQCT